jgi:hypothetical protein
MRGVGLGHHTQGWPILAPWLSLPHRSDIGSSEQITGAAKKRKAKNSKRETPATDECRADARGSRPRGLGQIRPSRDDRGMILIVQETAGRHGRFDGWIEGSQVVIPSSTQPFLDAARELMRRNVDPATVLIMRHKQTGTDSLRGRIGATRPRAATPQLDHEEIRGSRPQRPSGKSGRSLASLADKLNSCRFAQRRERRSSTRP